MLKTSIAGFLSIGCVLVVAGCGKSSSAGNAGSGGNSGQDAGSGSGGSASGTGAASGLTQCAGSTFGSCTQAEIATFTDCVTTACDSEYKTCLGAGYKSGTYSGPCGDHTKCVLACKCDPTCEAQCTQSSECTTCEESYATCGTSCSLPACVGLGDGGIPGFDGGGFDLNGFDLGEFDLAGLDIPSFDLNGFDFGLPEDAGGTCADLLACCNAATNTGLKDACQTVYNNDKNMGDSSCGTYLAAIKSSVCP